MKYENLIARLDFAEQELIDIMHEIEEELPVTYWKKMDTIVSKVTILKEQIIEKGR